MKRAIFITALIFLFSISLANADDSRVKIKLSRDNKGYKYTIESDDVDKILEVNEKLRKGLNKPITKAPSPQKPKVQ